MSRNATVGVHGYILVYSVASRASLEKLRNVNKMLFNMIGNPPSIPRVLVATMLDASEQRYSLNSIVIDTYSSIIAPLSALYSYNTRNF